MTHTPGPWRLIGVTCKGNGNKRSVSGATRRILDISLDDGEQEANARLIAAAPALLEALEACLPYMEDHMAMTLDQGPGDRIAYDKALAAIALAKGENK